LATTLLRCRDFEFSTLILLPLVVTFIIPSFTHVGSLSCFSGFCLMPLLTGEVRSIDKLLSSLLNLLVTKALNLSLLFIPLSFLALFMLTVVIFLNQTWILYQRLFFQVI